jgi:mono/diheme cytochrome c family protein
MRIVRLLLIVVAAVVVVGVAVAAWMVAGSRPMAFAGGQTVTLADYKGPSPTGVPTDFTAADPIARGQYLTRAADCQACHTAKGGAPFAGGLAFNLPFGTIWSPNITDDKDTGIGGWSDAQFIRAVRRGVDDQGQPLYPAMPYPAFTYMTDADVLAIKAYLFSLKPVHKEDKEDSLPFPLNQRSLMVIWRAMFVPDQRFQPRPDRSPQWNRGAYLAEAMAHCGDCHTPRTLAQSLDNHSKYAGAVAAGWKAYNITGHRLFGVGGWSDAEVAQYLATGHAGGRGTAAGPMGEAVDLSLSHLTPSDIAALVAYLRSIPPIATPDQPAPLLQPAPAQPKLGVAANVDPRGKRIFEGACASCHSWTGQGSLNAWATLTGGRAVNDPTATNVAQVVLSGANRRTATGLSYMPAFGRIYSNDEIAAVANYVTARFGAAPSNVTAKQVDALRKAASS